MGGGGQLSMQHGWRRRTGPLYFSAAMLAGGCLLFYGALRVHEGLYEHNMSRNVKRRMEEPSERRLQMLNLVMAERRDLAARRGQE